MASPPEEEIIPSGGAPGMSRVAEGALPAPPAPRNEASHDGHVHAHHQRRLPSVERAERHEELRHRSHPRDREHRRQDPRKERDVEERDRLRPAAAARRQREEDQQPAIAHPDEEHRDRIEAPAARQAPPPPTPPPPRPPQDPHNP